MSDSRTTRLLSILLAIIILLMLAIAGLFLRMLQLQEAVLTVLVPFQTAVLEQNVQSTSLAIGENAPVFTLLDINGETISLNDFYGQTILLGFSSLQCSACKQMYPSLLTLAENLDTIQVLLISQGSIDGNVQLVEEQSFDFPVLTWDDSVAQDYRIPGTPFFYVIGANGKIVERGFVSTLTQFEKLLNISKE